MSSSSDLKVEPESPSLFDYLRQEIALEDLKDYASPQRINSIDFVKGFAIIFIILAHVAEWLDPNWFYLYGLLFALLDILGPSLFVFLSALSVIFTLKRKEGLLPRRVIRNNIFTRGFVMIVLGMLLNLYAVDETTGQIYLVIWGWNIITFIGFSQIFSYFALKLKKLTRVIVGVLIIMLSPFLREIIYLGKETGNIFFGLLHYVVTSSKPDLTFLPWISISFLSTIFGEYLYQAMIKGTQDAYIGLFRLLFVWGLILVVIGVSIGFPLQTPETMVGGISEYPHLKLLIIANNQTYFQLPGFPLFLIRHTSANMFYSLGMAILIIAISFYFIDIKKKDNSATSMFIYMGKISLSLFLLHLLFIPLFLTQFSIVLFLIIALSYIGFLGLGMYVWMEYGKGIGTPEWFMVLLGRIGQKTEEKVTKTYNKTRKKLESYFIHDD